MTAHPSPPQAPVDDLDLGPLMAASRTITAAVVRSLAEVSSTVTVPQLRVLVMLSSRGRMNLSGIAAALGINVSNASRTCDQLVKAGLVDRQVDPHDRRHASLQLGRRGRSLVDDVMSHRERMLAAVVGRMPEASRHRLMAALTDFNTAAAAVDGSAAAAGTGPARDEAEHVDGDLAHWLS
jgi:DNA-binding MarR family transcriptional regulator